MNQKKIIIIFLLLLLILGVALRLLCIHNDFSAEETDFVKSAIAIKDTGHPKFYISEQQPYELGLWHPPMYILSMAAVFRIFGEGESAARSINIIFSILTAVLIFLFCKKVINDKNNRMIGLISSAIFLVNYYVFSSSILIDIDMLSAFFTLLFLFSIMMNIKSGKKYFLFLAVIGLFFSICNRYVISAAVYAAIGIYLYSKKDFKKYLKRYLFVGICSVAIFIVLWALYSIIIEPGTFFSFLTHNLQLGTEPLSNFSVFIGSFVINIAQFIRLTTLPGVILIILAFLAAFKMKENTTKILLIYSVVSLALFFIIPRPAYGYPRYFLTAFPTISILIGIYLNKNLGNFSKKQTIIGILAFLSSLTLLILLNPQSTIYMSNGLIKATNLPDFCFNLLASVPLVFVCAFKKHEKKIAIIVILIALFLSYNAFFDAKKVMYNGHIKDVGLYLKEKTSENDLIIAPKAVGYYAQRKFYINDNNKPELDLSYSSIKDYIQKSIDNPKMDDEFFWPNGYFRGIFPPQPSEEILKHAKYAVLYHPVENNAPEIKISEFYIYSLNQ